MMNLNEKPFNAPNALLDPNSAQKVLQLVVVLTLLTFIPLAIKNFYIGHWYLALLMVAFEIGFIIEVVGICCLKRSVIGHRIPLGFLLASIVCSVAIFGTLATYWVFPIIIALVFIIPHYDAIMTNVLMIIGCTWAAAMKQDLEIMYRFAIALAFCAVIAHFAVWLIVRLQSKLRYLSTRDVMTGALNRHQLDLFLQRALDGHKRYTASSIAIIDIDFFKQVNDRYGHDVGDEVINLVVETIQHNTREVDLLFRLGGDEFLLLFENTSASSALLIVSHLCQKVRKQAYPKHASVTLSAGIAECLEGDDVESWLKRADVALYQSKENGRDRVTLSEPHNLHRHTKEETDWPSFRQTTTGDHVSR
ncbi:TPA: GGDEF domain-containing protein [Vibrio vulnificus]|nr:GGDEF domain-containing protein [Vibrio vulnificus]